MVQRSADEVANRRKMTLEALADVDAGRVIDHKEVHAWAKSLADRTKRVTTQAE
jgi:predicted transcriptional regulator